MNIVERKIDKLGRIVLPMDFRKALGLEGEAEVVLGINGNTLTLRSADNTCRLCGSSEEVSTHLRICSKRISRIKGI